MNNENKNDFAIEQASWLYETGDDTSVAGSIMSVISDIHTARAMVGNSDGADLEMQDYLVIAAEAARRREAYKLRSLVANHTAAIAQRKSEKSIATRNAASQISTQLALNNLSSR